MYPLKSLFLSIGFGALIAVSNLSYAHNKVVVVPLGGADYKYQNPLIVPFSDFRTDGTTASESTAIFSGGYVRGVTGGGVGCILAPVYLPDGATMTLLEATTYNSTASTFSVNLYRAQHTPTTNTGSQSLGSMIAPVNQTTIQALEDNSISTQPINNKVYSYYVSTCLRDLGTRIYSFRIHFNE